MRGGSRLLAAAAACLALAPVPALAASRPQPPPRLGPTVDHPPVDGFNSFDNGPRGGNRIALTFDADMTPGMLQQLRSGAVRSWYNREVREILDAERVPATLFLTGLWAATYAEDARSLAEDPLFEVGSHTYDHAAFRVPCYGMAAARDRAAEILDAQGAIQAATGVTPTLVRFPGDCYDLSDVGLARQLGLLVISGDVRAGDGFNPSAASIAAAVAGHLQPGSIVVMHLHGGPNAPMTAPALRTIVQVARQRGLGFTTVSELLGREPARPPVRPQQVLAPFRALSLEPPPVAADDVLAPYRALSLEPPRRHALLD
ncbi:MAG TPA: polysaccharide deacetylase family protein [Candidatus Acidoferrales bacterium]|nr:polysaccharide deacetylase family protein [Candidatus Acidoferrales bacterium]